MGAFLSGLSNAMGMSGGVAGGLGTLIGSMIGGPGDPSQQMQSPAAPAEATPTTWGSSQITNPQAVTTQPSYSASPGSSVTNWANQYMLTNPYK